MEFLVLLLIVSNINLAFSDDNVTVKTSTTTKDTYKVHPEPEDSQNDQVAESSHFISQNYQNVQADSQVSDGIHNQHGTANLENLRVQGAVDGNSNIVQPVLTQTYTTQPHHTYVQHILQPIRILGAEVSPLRQTYEDDSHEAMGYSSYIEHVSQKDEEEIKSALKEGSVNDIKRLVPKSGISFKIYQNKGNSDGESKSSEPQSNLVAHLNSKIPTGITQKPRIHYKIKTEAPGPQIQIKTHELSPGIENLQQSILKSQSEEKQLGYEHSGGSSLQNEQTLHNHSPYYSQSDVNTPKPKLQFQTTLGGDIYNKGRTPLYNTVAVKEVKHLSDISNLQYQKQYDSKIEGSQKAVKKLKPLTSTHYSIDPLIQAEKNKERKVVTSNSYSHSSSGSGQGLGSFGQNSATATLNSGHFVQNSGHNLNTGLGSFGQNSAILGTHIQNGAIGNTYTQNGAVANTYTQNSAVGNTYTQNSVLGSSHAPNIALGGTFGQNSAIGSSYTHNSVVNNEQKHKISEAAKINEKYIADIKNNQKVTGLLFNKAYTEQKALFPGSVDNIKLQHNHVINAHHQQPDQVVLKHGHQQPYKTGFYSDSETAKTNQHELISHVGHTFTETKPSQDNFDHQKALEGSTSFDIKNAIDSGSLTHQTHYIPPEGLHSVGDIQKQQLTYVLPKIPSTVLIDNNIHETPVLDGHHQIKDYGSSTLTSPHVSYSIVSAPSGKFIHPQTLLWNTEHLKQGTEFHQPLIKLHLPKEEIQHVKSPVAELPTSTFSHVSYPQHKQPFLLHYDVPLVKYAPEIHFQPKTKTKIQTNQVKLPQQVAIDWSLFKNTVPSFNINHLAVKPEFIPHVTETGKKIVPILVRKRKNRSNTKKEIGVVYGKVNMNRRPAKPSQRQEKNVQINLLPEASNNNVRQIEGKGEKKNEFSVSASYKVDRSFKLPTSS